MLIPKWQSFAAVVGKFTGEWRESVGRRTVWKEELAGKSESELGVRPGFEPRANSGRDC